MSATDIIGILLALPDTIERLITFGKEINTQVERLKDPESLTRELKKFGIANNDNSLRLAAETCRRMAQSTNTPDDIKRMHYDDFKDFENALNEANRLVQKLLDKAALIRAINEYRYRKKLADQVQLVASARGQFIDNLILVDKQEGRVSFAKLDSDAFSIARVVHTDISDHIKLFDCHLTMKLGEVEPQEGLFLIEMRRPSPGVTEAELEKSAKEVAETLSVAHKSNAILNCIGWTDLPGPFRGFGIVFALPPEQKSFQTLAHYIQKSNGTKPALDVRVAFCKALASAVLQVHTLKPPMVHKNISPNNIVLSFQSDVPPENLDAENPLFLINWQLSRAANIATRHEGVTAWWQAVYQHPQRQVLRQEKHYTLNHDIYSLGVSMIEILLWQPLVQLAEDGKPELSGLLFDKGMRLPASADIKPDEWQGAKPNDVRNILENLATAAIPPVAGTELSKLIIKCMNGLQLEQDKPEQDVLGFAFTSEIKDLIDRINI